jgi:hypothetical protein
MLSTCVDIRDLQANGEVQEFEEGDEPTDFLEMLDIDPEDRSSYAKADVSLDDK